MSYSSRDVSFDQGDLSANHVPAQSDRSVVEVEADCPIPTKRPRLDEKGQDNFETKNILVSINDGVSQLLAIAGVGETTTAATGLLRSFAKGIVEKKRYNFHKEYVIDIRNIMGRGPFDTVQFFYT